MKKLIAIVMMLLTVIMVGCDKKARIGAVTLGDTYEETVKSLEKENLAIEHKEDGSVVARGEVYILDVPFDNVFLQFNGNKLEAATAQRKFSTLSKTESSHIKSRMSELCGYMYSDVNKVAAGFGTKSHNNGCIGGIKVEWDEYRDMYFVTIGLVQ